MALTQESLLSFLLEHGGKVKNSELVNNFRTQINCGDPAEKQHNRDLFKKLVNSVAVVKQIDEVKFVVVKKRYQDFVREGAYDATPQKKTQMDDEHNSSFSFPSPHRAEAGRVIYSDIENNNTCYPSNINGSYCSEAKRKSVGGMHDKRQLLRSNSGEATTVKVLNISGDQTSKARKSGAVFAVIAVKSPPRDSAPAAQDEIHSPVRPPKTSDKPITFTTKVSSPSTLNLNFPAYKKSAQSESQCWKNKQMEDMQPPRFPLGRSQSKRDDAKYSESVPLEPLAHEWLVKCAAGLWGHIHGLLLQDTRLAQKKDFMSGFTALHWAAKDGNSEMIHKLLDISRRRGTCVNINSKAHGGYTPLHIAAMHGHTEVMFQLVQGYGASVNERDNDGKKAFHYLGKHVSSEVRALMGGLQHSKCREKIDNEEYREHQKGFNTISKLFQPHIGRKQKN
ncbi:ankyrin repeat domain-containing protein SOWAHA [Notothenia coriiceps]|uniref:Ankyrin repeat domain-containing protein SOWAHA n=1 Tax=Notothenia coriiceps TaxID=8208 RepID=A0A6I9P1N0_9TELE|nr:PREDICTED: ankyrin repeat domain-containing protein SOWAHA [Notothenia coriiceps]